MSPGLIIFMLCLAGMAAVFAARYFLLRRSLSQARRQMDRINREPGSNERLSCAAPDAGLAGLLSEINKSLAEDQAVRIDHENREREFRRQIANISHDLRTPLTSVLGYLELLEDAERAGGPLTGDERREYLEIVNRKARALQELIGQFYDLSRLESGEYKLELAAVDLHGLLCEALAAFYQDLEEGGFRTEVELREELPLVLADPGAVKRVFFNLLQNILVHGQGRVRIAQYLEGEAIVTRLENEAEGIEETDMEHIFERFYTADATRSGQSTGLGMTITKRLLERMGHQVAARLEPAGAAASEDAQTEPEGDEAVRPAPAGADKAAADGKLFVAEIRWNTVPA